MGDKSRLETLLERQKALETAIAEEKTKAAAEAVLNTIGKDVAGVVTKAAAAKSVDLSVLHGKFFALNVEDGKLTVTVATKATGTRKATTTTNGNGGGEYDYFLADGRGPFESVQKAMDALAVPAADRPSHNRYDRLSADWQKKIVRKVKAAAAPAEAAPAEGDAPAEAAEAAAAA